MEWVQGNMREELKAVDNDLEKYGYKGMQKNKAIVGGDSGFKRRFFQPREITKCLCIVCMFVYP